MIILYGHGDPNTNLLAIISIVSFLLFLKGHVVRRLYNDWKTDIIETIRYLNIVLFSAIKMVILNTSNQRVYHDIATNISGLTILLLLTYILICQFLTEVIGDQCWTNLKQRLRCRIRTDGGVGSHSDHNTTDNGQIENQQKQPKPTSSVIEGNPISEKSHLNDITEASTANIEVSDNDNDDDCSFASADSAAPLLGREV